MIRAEAQRLLDAVEPGHAVTITSGRSRSTRRVIYAGAHWNGATAWRSTKATALCALVREVYTERGLTVPETVPSQLSLAVP